MWESLKRSYSISEYNLFFLFKFLARTKKTFGAKLISSCTTFKLTLWKSLCNRSEKKIPQISKYPRKLLTLNFWLSSTEDKVSRSHPHHMRIVVRAVYPYISVWDFLAVFQTLAFISPKSGVIYASAPIQGKTKTDGQENIETSKGSDRFCEEKWFSHVLDMFMGKIPLLVWGQQENLLYMYVYIENIQIYAVSSISRQSRIRVHALCRMWVHAPICLFILHL